MIICVLRTDVIQLNHMPLRYLVVYHICLDRFRMLCVRCESEAEGNELNDFQLREKVPKILFDFFSRFIFVLCGMHCI